MLTQDELEEIASRMVGVSGNNSLQAGYTYLGQLISHDIVPPTAGRTRYIDKTLSLRSIYGEPADHARYFDVDGRFIVQEKDVQRSETGEAIIAESRNDENLIVCQLHRFWQGLHNHLIDAGLVANFDEARAATIRLFQLIVIEDFLAQLLTRRVFRFHFEQNQQLLNLAQGGIPAEFSMAAYRFGHSMVRNVYRLQVDGQTFDLVKLMRFGKKLKRKHHIDWRLFFGPDRFIDIAVQRARGIDPQIAEGMTTVHRPGGDVNIVEANLKATATLPSAMTLIDQIKTEHPEEFRQLDIPRFFMNLSVFRGLSVSLDRLPLWPYILMEAGAANSGKRLSGLGSLIVADVLRTCIAEAPVSVFDHDIYSFEQAVTKLPPAVQNALSDVTASHPSARKLTMHQLIQLVNA